MNAASKQLVPKLKEHFVVRPMMDRLAATQYREHLATLKSLLERTQDLPEVMPHVERARLHELITAGAGRLAERDRAPVAIFEAEQLHARIRATKRAIWSRAEASAARQGLCAVLILREVR